MFKKLYTLTIILPSIFLVTTSNAQTIGGNSLVVIAPAEPLSNTYAAGLSFNGNFEIPIPTLNKLRGNVELGYQSWSLEDDNDTNVEANSISMGAGGKYFLNRFFVGTDAVYYFGDLKELTIVPNVGIRIGKFNIEASASLHDTIPFLSLELGYFWAY